MSMVVEVIHARPLFRKVWITRQPVNISKQEKLDYVQEVIRVHDMEAYAGAVVGVPGEGNARLFHRSPP